MAETVRRHKPLLYIEIHGADQERKIANIRAIVQLLDAYGYSIHHVETGQTITASNAAVAKEGHIFCRTQ